MDIIAVLAWVAALALLGLWLRWERRQTVDMARYRLFRVRSELVSLVATGEISPEDPAFYPLYELVNISIANTKDLTRFLTGLDMFATRSQRKDLLARIHDVSIRSAHSKPQVKEIARKYFLSLEKIL